MSITDSVTFTISGLTVKLCFEKLPVITPAFSPFVSESEPEYTVIFNKKDVLPPLPEAIIAKEKGFVAVSDGRGGYNRFFIDGKSGRLYAVGRYDWQSRRIDIDYLGESESAFSESGNSFFHLAWEKLLAKENRFMLHAACVDTPLGGILFTGPSGIGKSTQGELWCSFGGGELINGDRPIIAKATNGFKAFGSPYAGSSKCYVSKSCNIKAIVRLSKASECSLSLLDPKAAFKTVFSGLTVNSWDSEFTFSACDFAERLAESVPVYSLSCTPDKNAVDILARELKGGI